MLDRFVVEADRQVVGIGVRVAGGYQFFTSDPAFQFMEGKVFARAKTFHQRIRQVAKHLRQRTGSAR